LILRSNIGVLFVMAEQAVPACQSAMTAMLRAMQQTSPAPSTLSSKVTGVSDRTMPTGTSTIGASAVSTTRTGATLARAAGLSAAAVSTAMAALAEYTTAPAMSARTMLRAATRGHGYSYEEEQATENRFHRRESLIG
jgi:hypothetical protein